MTSSVLLIISVLLLLAYVFEITTSRIRVPSVILLLLLGFLVKILFNFFSLELPDLSPVLPILGTTGLILIVLEGSLELDIDKSKFPLIIKSIFISIIPILLISFGLAYYLVQITHVSLKTALSNAIPISIISSAIAIPSAKNLMNHDREFITYESSLSDIFGVIFFNFVVLNDNIEVITFGQFSLDLVIMLIISLVSTVLLAIFLDKIKHHIKFIPIILFIVLIYVVSKEFHFPALIFILIFGLFMSNSDKLRRFSLIQRFHPVNFSRDVEKFREITTELAFLIRALFFILFGYLLQMANIVNVDTILLATAIVGVIFLVRFIILSLFKVKANPIVFIAPRGLITILLFLSIPATQQISIMNKSLVTQIIILSALIMMFGLMRQKSTDPAKIERH